MANSLTGYAKPERANSGISPGAKKMGFGQAKAFLYGAGSKINHLTKSNRKISN
jgi:hypothetical protein